MICRGKIIVVLSIINIIVLLCDSPCLTYHDTGVLVAGAIELASTRWLEGALLVGLGPEGHEVKKSPEKEAVGEHARALEAELDALPTARKDLALSGRASMPGEVVQTCPTSKASRENLDTLSVAGWKLFFLSLGPSYPGKPREPWSPLVC